MAPLNNARHEAFCRALAEGHSVAESYRLAGYQNNTGNASRLNANDSIRGRVSELQASAAAKTEVTLETILAELADAAAVAKDRGQAQALVSAAMSKAKLLGLDVQRIEVGGPGDFDGLTSTAAIVDRELELLIEQFRPVDAADKKGLIELHERHLKEAAEYIAAIKARPIIAQRVNTRDLKTPWQELELYAPKSPARIGYRNRG